MQSVLRAVDKIQASRQPAVQGLLLTRATFITIALARHRQHHIDQCPTGLRGGGGHERSDVGRGNYSFCTQEGGINFWMGK